jgi:hypothetical protein
MTVIDRVGTMSRGLSVRHVFHILACSGLAVAWLGCGDPNAVKPLTVYPVNGKVLLKDDKPLTKGQVVFVLSAKGLEFASPIGADGTFKMSSQFGDGIPDGDYLVRIDPSATESAAARKVGGKSTWSQPYPVLYSDESASGLRASIKAGDNTLEPFRLVEGSASTKSKAGKSGRPHDD